MSDLSSSELPRIALCHACGGDGYSKAPRLGDEPCANCKGFGVSKDSVSRRAYATLLAKAKFTDECLSVFCQYVPVVAQWKKKKKKT